MQITTDAQGTSVVSARELYESLGFNMAHWAKWSKKNIEINPFAEKGRDWEGFTLSVNGNQTTDYALSIDFAERLCMLARTEKGEQVRRWFQAIKNKALQAPARSSTEELLLQVVQQQAQLLTNQQTQLEQLRITQQTQFEQLRAELAQISRARTTKRSTKRYPGPSNQLELPYRVSLPLASMAGLRKQVSGRINDYCGQFGVSQQETYTHLYKRMWEVYGINVRRLIRPTGGSLLDAVEQYGQLDKLYALAMAELKLTGA